MLIARIAAVCLFALGLAGVGLAVAQVGTRPFFAAPPAAITTSQFFVAASGSDGANCSSGTPCQTIAHMNGLTYTGAVVINFNGGDTFTGTINPTAATAATAITLQSYGTGKATISSGTGDGVDIFNHGNVVISSLIFTGSGGAGNFGINIVNNQPGNTKLQNVTISNNSVSGYGSNGVMIVGRAGTSGFNNVLISDNSVTGNTIGDNITASGSPGGWTAGISTFSGCFTGSTCGTFSYAGYGLGATVPSHTNVTITGNTVSGNNGVAGARDWTGSGIVLGECGTCTTTLNIMHNNGSLSDSGAGPGNSENFDNGSATISFNEAYLAQTAMADGDNITLDGGNVGSIAEYNYSHNAVGVGIYLSAFTDVFPVTMNNTGRYNISENDAANSTGFGGLNISAEPGTPNSSLTNARLYNNTVWGPNTIGFSVQEYQDFAITGIVANNILATAFQLVAAFPGASGLAIESNNYFTLYSGGFTATWAGVNYYSLSSFQTGTGKETTPLASPTATPFLFNLNGGGTCGGYSTTCPTAYQLTPSSSLVGVGLNLTMAPYSLSVGTQDYYGNAIPRSGTYNVGAYGGAGATPGGTSPIVVAVAPYEAAAGASVTIGGFNFTGATAVKFGATNATSFSCSTATVCTATVPAGTTGAPVFVTVTTPVATSGNVTASVFTYVPTQYYFDVVGTDTPGGNGCKAGTGTAACSTITQFNSITYSGAIIANFNGSFTDSCPAVNGGFNFSGATSVVLDGHGTTTITANAADAVHCAPPANFGTQVGGGFLVENISAEQFVKFTGFTLRGNGGSSEYGILLISTVNNTTISNNDVQGFWCDPSTTANAGCFFGSDIANRSGGVNVTIVDNFVHGATVTAKDDNGIECNNCTTINSMISGNTVTNIGGGPTPSHQTGVGRGITTDSGSFTTQQYNLTHDIGANPRTCGGPSGILNGGFYNYIRRNESYNVQPSGSYDGSGCDWDGFDCDDVGGNLSNCIENYAHNNWGSGLLLFVSDKSPWANDSMSYNISENDNAHVNDRTGGAMAITGGCATTGPTLVANNTVYQDAGGLGRNTIAASITCPQEGIWANNLIAVTAGPTGQASFITTFFQEIAINFMGNGYYAISGTPTWYQVAGGTTNSLATWQSMTIGGDLGAILGTNPMFSGTVPAGTCTWIVSSAGPGPIPCPAAYGLGGSSSALGAGAAINHFPFTVFTLFGVNLTDYFANAIPVAPPNLHNMGAYDTGGGTESNSPVVSLTSPSPGTVSGTIVLTATTSESGGNIQGVDFFLDGVSTRANLFTALTGASLADPCAVGPLFGVSGGSGSAAFNTLCVENGTHTFAAVAYDFSGKSTTSSTITVTVSNSIPSCTEATNFLNRAGFVDFPATTYYATQYKILICGGVSDGWWSKLDVLQVYNTYGAAGSIAYSPAILNLISTNFTASLIGVPNWTQAQGFNAVASNEFGHANSMIDTGYAPSAGGNQYTLNSASVMTCSIERGGGTPHIPAVYNGTTVSSANFYTDIFPDFSGATYGRVNEITSAGLTNSGNSTLFVGANRSGVSAEQLYIAGSLAASPNATSTMVDSGHLFIGGNGTTTYYDGLVQSFAAGGSLTGTDWSNLYSRIRAWNLAVSAGSC